MPLSDYGRPLFSHQGEGSLRLRSGDAVPCSFEAGQLSNGEVLVLAMSSTHTWGSDVADRFAGQTANGSRVDATLDIPINVLGRARGLAPGTYFAYRALAFQVDAPTASQVSVHRYGLVNWRFAGTSQFTSHDTIQGGPRYGWRLDLRLADARGEIIANVEPVADYSHISTELSTTRGIALTSECVIDARSLQAGIDPDDLVKDLCLLLSVARGTRVQWLYRRDEDALGAEVRMTLRSHITKPYQVRIPRIVITWSTPS
jgi:hypothetical protein